MKKYIRFGSIPTSGRSLNYIKLTADQRRDFSDLLDDGRTPEEAYKIAREYYNGWNNINIDDILENGISAFNADENGLPVIQNMTQAQSLAVRIDKQAYILTGEESGTGQDGEPLLVNVAAKEVDIPIDSLINVIINFLSSVYSRKSGTIDREKASQILEFSDSVMYAGIEFTM